MIQLYLNIPDRKQLVTRMKELTGGIPIHIHAKMCI